MSDLTYAARQGLAYHLWWHPHNFGSAWRKISECCGGFSIIFIACANVTECRARTWRRLLCMFPVSTSPRYATKIVLVIKKASRAILP